MDLSVVVPVYKSASTLEPLCTRLNAALARLPGVTAFELIFVEDGGGDGSWEILQQLAAQYPHVTALKLSRNFGQHSAITAGLTVSTGRWVAVMDCDLQDRPEDLHLLWAKAGPDVDVVCARRIERQDSLWRRLSSRVWFKLFTTLSGIEYDPAVANFRLVSRAVVDAYLNIGERVRSFGGQVHWLGFETAYVDVTHDPRAEGKSSYSLAAILDLALSTIVSNSNKPLRMSVWLGLGICLITACVMIWVFYHWMTTTRGVSGWTSLILSVWFLGGVIVANLGLIGIYLGKTYDETKRRPSFVIARRVN